MEHRGRLPLALLAIGVAGACSVGGPGRVIVLGLDGLDPRAVDRLMAEGKLPHFARLRQDGAYARLGSPRPSPADPAIWTTVATGKPPELHGVGPVQGADETGGPALATRGMRRAKAVWNILSEAGKRVAVVGWWATWPAEAVRGSLVSDRVPDSLLSSRQEADGFRGLTHPPELLGRMAPLIRRPDEMAHEAGRLVPEGPQGAGAPRVDLEGLKRVLAASDSYRRMGLDLWRREHPDLLMVALPAADAVSHLPGLPAGGRALSGEGAVEEGPLGDAVERTYGEVDRLVGEYAAAMDGRTTLVVLSDHGFERGTQGVLYLFGHGVRRGGRMKGPTALDITPTVLALTGLAVAHDMPGRVLTEALDLQAPGPRIASYETPAGEGAGAGRGPEPVAADERGWAAAQFAAGRFQEAAAAYARLVEKDPADAALRTSLAGVLGAMGQYQEALKQLEVAIRLAPLNPEAYHNRGAVLERLGRRAGAIEQYRAAVKYSPQYEPSRRALLRLTGSAQPDPPRNERERRARQLADDASEAARRGDYARAMELLDEAERLAPRYALVHQYRSNVAYLTGNHAEAIRALEKALSLDPGNALYAANLARLKREGRAERP